MKFLIQIFLLLSFSTSLFAQDIYYSNLLETLAAGYGATNGEWVIDNTEAGVLATATTYGANATTVDVADQDFTLAGNITVSNQGNNPWDAGRFNKNANSIAAGDAVLVTFYIRSVNGPGEVNIFAENESTFAKEYFFQKDLDEEWSQFFIAFESTSNYQQGGLNIGFHLGLAAQQLEIGGLAVVNFKNNISADQLPNDINNDEYGGFETDAPWRSQAANNIETLRKANLVINAVDQNNNPLSEGTVQVSMNRHQYVFGTAVKACAFAGNSCQNFIYEEKIHNLDGNGHGFNSVVFENDVKWDLWEGEFLSSHEEVANSLDWLIERNIEPRGHVLVWPGNQFLPDDVAASNDVNYVKTRINNHLEEILNYPSYVGKITEWDAINEIVVNRDLENLFKTDANYETGRELYVEIFEKAKEISPETRLYLNDYVTLTLGNEAGSPQYDRLLEFLGEIVDAGAPIDGIGFQGHIGTFPNSIYDVLDTYDDFYDAYGLTAKITEYDMPDAVGEELAATYLDDFLTATFGHASTDGFLFWSFWDGATYMNPGANLFRSDWTQTPAGDKFIDLVFNEWWTDEPVEISNGVANIRGFKGTYDISYECNGELVSFEIELTEDQEIEIQCDAISVNTIDIKPQAISVYPTPSSGTVIIERNLTDTATLEIYNLLGAIVQSKVVTGKQVSVEIDEAGTYFVRMDDQSIRIVIQ